MLFLRCIEICHPPTKSYSPWLLLAAIDIAYVRRPSTLVSLFLEEVEERFEQGIFPDLKPLVEVIEDFVNSRLLTGQSPTLALSELELIMCHLDVCRDPENALHLWRIQCSRAWNSLEVCRDPENAPHLWRIQCSTVASEIGFRPNTLS